jgi:hypothetical protein
MATVTINTLEFTADLRAFAEQIDADLDQVVRKTAIDLYGKVVERTPVDTGRARANWNISTDSPDFTTTDAGQYPEMQNNAALTAATKAERVLGQGDVRVVWIANGLPYINRLNHGHSQQAPSAFVETAITEVEAEIDAATR